MKGRATCLAVKCGGVRLHLWQDVHWSPFRNSMPGRQSGCCCELTARRPSHKVVGSILRGWSEVRWVPINVLVVRIGGEIVLIWSTKRRRIGVKYIVDRAGALEARNWVVVGEVCKDSDIVRTAAISDLVPATGLLEDTLVQPGRRIEGIWSKAVGTLADMVKSIGCGVSGRGTILQGQEMPRAAGGTLLDVEAAVAASF